MNELVTAKKNFLSPLYTTHFNTTASCNEKGAKKIITIIADTILPEEIFLQGKVVNLKGKESLAGEDGTLLMLKGTIQETPEESREWSYIVQTHFTGFDGVSTIIYQSSLHLSEPLTIAEITRRPDITLKELSFRADYFGKGFWGRFIRFAPEVVEEANITWSSDKLSVQCFSTISQTPQAYPIAAWGKQGVWEALERILSSEKDPHPLEYH